MVAQAIAPVRRSRRERPRRRVTAFEAVSLTLAVFAFGASALGTPTQEVLHVAPGEAGPGSLLGPLMFAALIASPALVSLGVRALLRQMKRRSHPGAPLPHSVRLD